MVVATVFSELSLTKDDLVDLGGWDLLKEARGLVAELSLEQAKIAPVHEALLAEFERLDDALYTIRLKRARPIAGDMLQSRLEDFLSELPQLAASICLSLGENPTMFANPARAMGWLTPCTATRCSG